MAGGDNGSGAKSSKEAPGDDEDPGASYIEAQRRAAEDPGDREIPLDREHGNPWEPNLTDIRRARRLEGRKLSTRNTIGSKVGESFYRVDRFRRFLPDRGMRGIVQFWGIKASRTYIVDDGPGEWIKDEKRRLHTVEIDLITKIK